MSKNRLKFCYFCLKTEEEEALIDTRTNLIQIENECFEFSTIYKSTIYFDPLSDYTCESCKDQFVQFYIFKSSIKIPQNPIKFIFSQIDDFLKDICVNDIKVIRTINSITLQHEDESRENVPKEENDIVDDFITLTEDTSSVVNVFEVLNEAVTCKQCGNIESSEIDLEIHEFLNHSRFGIQLSAEIDNCKVIVNHSESTSMLYVCSLCSTQLDNGDILLLHFIDEHQTDIIAHLNNCLMLPHVNTELIANYLNYMKDCINGTNEKIAETDDKNYFYSTYNVQDDDEIIADQSIQEHSDIDMGEESTEIKREAKNEKPRYLFPDDKEWIRTEIARGKFVMSSENQFQKTIYRCTISKDCNYVSKSSPGLRYHLIMTHLRDRKKLTEKRNREDSQDDSFLPPSFNAYVSGTKNSCIDCCLKFKDSRSYQLHEKCHELFQVVAQHSSFFTCNSCNIKFISVETLNDHLERHKMREGQALKEPVTVSIGAVREQGKLLKSGITHTSLGETSEIEYTWKCGHCAMKNFTNEDFCNFHLLMTHVTSFSCPIDRMEFSGFKSVSLFIHHLRNKHPDLFPHLSFKCTFCQMEFSTIYEKLQHMKNCESKQLQCDHCMKRFFKKTDLAAHLKIVTGEIQFECGICLKRCLSASDLKIHLRTHSKIKPYPCSLCSKSFRTLAARANHVECHNATQSYPCEYCGKSFKQRQMFRRHMKTVHEKKAS